MAQQWQLRFCSTGMQVQSSVQHNGLKDLVFPQLCRRSQLQLGSDPRPPGPGTLYAAGQPKKEKKKTQFQYF